MFVALSLLVWMMSHHGESVAFASGMYVDMIRKKKRSQKWSLAIPGRPELERKFSRFERWSGPAEPST